VSYTVSVQAVNAVGSGPAASVTLTVQVGGAIVPVTPVRIADSRTALQIPGAVRALGSVEVQVTGQGGIPGTGVAAAVLTVTAVAPTADGYLTVWPAGTTRTDTSNLNFVAGQNIPNTVIVPVGDTGAVGIFNGSPGGVHVLVDVTGYIADGTATADGMFVPVRPSRIADSRTGQQIPGPVPALGTVKVQLTDLGEIPGDAAAVVLTVTAVAPTGSGFVTAWPAGIERTTTSSLNFVAGQTIPNTVIVRVGSVPAPPSTTTPTSTRVSLSPKHCPPSRSPAPPAPSKPTATQGYSLPPNPDADRSEYPVSGWGSADTPAEPAPQDQAERERALAPHPPQQPRRSR
jgi:hypothetical protein